MKKLIWCKLKYIEMLISFMICPRGFSRFLIIIFCVDFCFDNFCDFLGNKILYVHENQFVKLRELSSIEWYEISLSKVCDLL